MKHTPAELVSALEEAKQIIVRQIGEMPLVKLTLIVDVKKGYVELLCPKELAHNVDVVTLHPDDPDPCAHGGPHDAEMASLARNELHQLEIDQI